ncbi:MAG: MFS transporter, partial [Burkholderiales bacterium]
MTELPRTVQSYIDQTPAWPDGTPTDFIPMTGMQWRIWLLASAGKFFEGLVVFMTGVALPLIVKDFGLSPVEKGIVSAAPLAGIMVGAIALGGLADIYGRRRMFVVEMIVFALFLTGLTWSPNYLSLVVFLFGVGLALGCDYPTAHLVISESIASKDRGKLVLSAFAFQAIGALVGTVVGFLILSNLPEISAWRWMYATAILQAILVVLGRLRISDSGHWLMSQGRKAEAEAEVARLLEREPPYPKEVRLADLSASEEAAAARVRRTGGWRELFILPGRRATILASVPWFLQDLATYGIGIFTPTILVKVIGHEDFTAQNVSALIARDILAAKGAALLDVLLIVGILAAVLLGLLFGLPTLRLRADYLAIVTIAAAEVIRQTISAASFSETFGGQDGVTGFIGAFRDLNPYSEPFRIGGIEWSAYDFWVMTVGWVLVAICCVIVWLLMRSPWGRVLKAIREDEEAARALGKNVFAHKMQALTLGG